MSPRGRILMLTQDLRIDRRILREAEALGEDGWSVTVLGLGDPHGKPRDDPPGVVRAYEESLVAMRERAVLGIYRMVRSRLPMNGRLMRSLKSIAWGVVANPARFYANLLRGKAREHAADIVVAHDLPMLPLAAELAEFHGAALVYDSHELYLGRPMTWLERRRWRRIEAFWTPRCAAITTVNRSIAGELERRYGLPRVDVITNGERPFRGACDVNVLRHRAGFSPESRIVLYQGGLLAGRNLETLVDAIAYVSDPRIHLVFLGDGVLGESLADRAVRRGVQDRVRLIPAVTQDELLAITASADLGVVPYLPSCLNTRYCTPNKLYEFLAAGIPVLSHELPEIRSLIDEYGFGWVASLADPSSAARAIEACFASESVRLKRKQSALAARETLSWDREAEKVRLIYRRVHGSPADDMAGRVAAMGDAFRDVFDASRASRP